MKQMSEAEYKLMRQAQLDIENLTGCRPGPLGPPQAPTLPVLDALIHEISGFSAGELTEVLNAAIVVSSRRLRAA